MYLGKLCEVAPSERLYADPAHPYTKVLIDAIPVPDPTVVPAPPATGEPPSAVFARMPAGRLSLRAAVSAGDEHLRRSRAAARPGRRSTTTTTSPATTR